MNNPRANIANLVAAAGGALLLLSTFLGWFGFGDENYSAWKFFSLTDIVLVAIALAALALGAAGATGNAANLPNFLRPSILKWLGTVALTISLVFAFELSSGELGEGIDVKIGAILAVLASAAILAGGILNDRPDLAAKLNEATAGIGSGGGPGAGPGHGAPGGAPQQPTPAGTPAATPPAATPPAAAPPAASPQEPATQQQPAAGGGGAAESSGPAPGWYPDPQGQKRLRYWDGGRWTEQTAD